MEPDLFRLRDVRKTYDVGRIPDALFPECRLEVGRRPSGGGWREVCGSHEVCREECPRCWTLSIRDMAIRRGCTTAVLGHSGSGKTTLLYLLALLHSPDSDSGLLEIEFGGDGEPSGVAFRDAAWHGAGLNGRPVDLNRVRRRRFGFIFQAGYLTSSLTALQNVALPLALAGTRQDEIDRRASGILERISFPRDRFRALPRHLSGGEYQRVAVARALAHDPDVLFADEPTGNLDPVTGEAVMELLGGWRQQVEGRTLVLVTHNIEHALRYAAEIFVLSGGQVTLARPRSEVSREDVRRALGRRQLVVVR